MRRALGSLAAWVCACGLASCGGDLGPQATTEIHAVFPLTKADCPSLPSTTPIKAKLIIEELESQPCELKVVEDARSGSLSVSGECAEVSTSKDRRLTLRWYVKGPSTGKEVLLAESVGRASLTTAKNTVVDVFFDPKDPALRPKTKACLRDSAGEEDRFNCDRTGVDTCDSSQTPTPGSGTNADTCSNLEELCRGTLFVAASTLDQTCPAEPAAPLCD